MAENMIVSAGNSTNSPELIRSPRGMELIKIVGTATAPDDTSNAYTCKFLQNPAILIGGGFAGAFSGRTVTLTALHALGSNTAHIWVAEAL
jgi:hypothetical protein